MLVDHGNALTPRIGHSGNRRFDPVSQYLAAVRLINPRQNLHYGALAGTILSRQRMHRAAVQSEVDVAQDFYRSEMLRDPLEFNDRTHYKMSR